MTETTVEKTVRNKLATIIGAIFSAALVAIVVKDFYHLFHSVKNSAWDKVLPGIQLAGAVIAILWLSLLMIVSSMSMSGPSFRKTCPYTVTMIIVIALEAVPRYLNAAPGWVREAIIAVGCICASIVLLQMLAFSLDPHSNSLFAAFRPFKIEVLTVIQLSPHAPGIKRASGRSSIV